MNKTTATLLIIISLFFPIFAYPDTTPDEQPTLYCPQQINCTVDGQLDSCEIEGDTAKYWMFGPDANNGRIVKGIYNFKSVDAKYEIPIIDYREPVCQYTNQEENIERLIKLDKAAIQNKFMASPSSSTQWSIVGYQGSCISNDPKQCPLTESPELVFDYNGVSAFFYLEASHIAINYLSYESALEACGNISNCEMSVKTRYPNGFDAGSVVIDVTESNVIKVVSITSSASSPYKLEKEDPFNTIAFIKK